MDLRLHDLVELKKPHPCGAVQWEILRVGMDIKLRCLGCGYEHRCSVRGCAINRAAAEMIEKLAAENEALRNPPLTLEELREMDGEPVFCVSAARPEDTAWGIVCIRGMNPYVKTMKGGCSTFFYLTSYSSAWLAYRRKPEE